VPASGPVKVRQVAVDPAFQRVGLGRRVMALAENVARELERDVELHARQVSAAFYDSLGYHPVGKPFVEVGLPHLKMVKSLSEL
jgi:predicted GNAT family N-acyltransferase